MAKGRVILKLPSCVYETDPQTRAWCLPSLFLDSRLPPVWPSDGPTSACFAGVLTLLGLAPNRLPPLPCCQAKSALRFALVRKRSWAVKKMVRPDPSKHYG